MNSTSRIHEFNFTNSRIQLHEFTNSISRIPLHEFSFTNSPSWIHEFNFTNSTSRIQLHEFTNSTSGIHEFHFTNSTSGIQQLNSWSWIREFVKLNSWIREVDFVKWNSWSWLREFMKLNSWIHEVEFVNSWSWILEVEFVKLNSWIREVEFVKLKSWIREVEIVNSWSWNREFVKLKPWINVVEMSLPVFRRDVFLLISANTSTMAMLRKILSEANAVRSAGFNYVIKSCPGNSLKHWAWPGAPNKGMPPEYRTVRNLKTSKTPTAGKFRDKWTALKNKIEVTYEGFAAKVTKDRLSPSKQKNVEMNKTAKPENSYRTVRNLKTSKTPTAGKFRDNRTALKNKTEVTYEGFAAKVKDRLSSSKQKNVEMNKTAKPENSSTRGTPIAGKFRDKWTALKNKTEVTYEGFAAKVKDRLSSSKQKNVEMNKTAKPENSSTRGTLSDSWAISREKIKRVAR